jgi:hypothetical protein
MSYSKTRYRLQKPIVSRDLIPEPDYVQGDKYHFCEGCPFKSKIYQGDRLIKYTCPARFDPYESDLDEHGLKRSDGKGCPKNLEFLKREKAKNDYEARNRQER